MQGTQLMTDILSLIEKVNFSAGELNIVDGKEQPPSLFLLLLLLFPGRGFARGQIGKIKALVLMKHDPAIRIYQGKGPDDNGAFKKRNRLQIDLQSVKGDKRFRAVRLLHGKTVDRRLQGIGIDFHLPDRCRSVQRLGQFFFQLTADYSRQNKKAENGIEKKRAADHDRPALPPGQGSPAPHPFPFSHHAPPLSLTKS